MSSSRSELPRVLPLSSMTVSVALSWPWGAEVSLMSPSRLVDGSAARAETRSTSSAAVAGAHPAGALASGDSCMPNRWGAPRSPV